MEGIRNLIEEEKEKKKKLIERKAIIKDKENVIQKQMGNK